MSKGATVSHLQLIAGAGMTTRQSRADGDASLGRSRAHVCSVAERVRAQEAPLIKPVEHEAQGWLFPDVALLGVVDMSAVRASAFEALLRATKPRWIMDLRAVPLFEYGSMTRKSFFGLCKQLDIIYRDVAGLAEVSSRKDASLSSGSIVPLINELLSEFPGRGAPGPLLFLLESTERASVALQVLPLLVEPRPAEGWTVCIYNVW